MLISTMSIQSETFPSERLPPGHDARVGKERVNAAKFFPGQGGQRLHVRQTGHVGGENGGVSPQLGGQRFQPVSPPGPQYHLGAPGGQRPGSGRTDARGGAGDDDDFVFDVLHNLSSFLAVVLALGQSRAAPSRKALPTRSPNT